MMKFYWNNFAATGIQYPFLKGYIVIPITI